MFRHNMRHNSFELQTRRMGLCWGVANSIDYIITLAGRAELQIAVRKVNLMQDFFAVSDSFIVSRCYNDE